MEIEKDNTKSHLQKFDIDKSFQEHGLCRSDDFKYNVGDCLFDSFAFLLKFQLTSTEICKGVINFSTNYLCNFGQEAIDSFNLELNPETLKELHNIVDPNIHL